MIAKRFPQNPIIHSSIQELENKLKNNINGPSLIKIPKWIKKPLGKYYLYFAHHKGNHIRLAYSNSLKGPWKIHKKGTLKMNQTLCNNHIASPDIHIDNKNKKIILYYHGGINGEKNQLTYVATSDNGINFKSENQPLGPFYFRVFNHNNKYYAIAKNSNESGGILLESNKYNEPFKKIKKIIPRMRHCAIHKLKNELLVFYSRIGDSPERIIMNKISLNNFKTLSTHEIIKPEKNYEGVNEPLKRSTPGISKKSVNQLRDPAIYEENNKLYLLYTNAGEKGICIAQLNLKEIKKKIKSNYLEELLHKLFFFRIINKIKKWY